MNRHLHWATALCLLAYCLPCPIVLWGQWNRGYNSEKERRKRDRENKGGFPTLNIGTFSCMTFYPGNLFVVLSSIERWRGGSERGRGRRRGVRHRRMRIKNWGFWPRYAPVCYVHPLLRIINTKKGRCATPSHALIATSLLYSLSIYLRPGEIKGIDQWEKRRVDSGIIQ
jgi:hypothetical protein